MRVLRLSVGAVLLLGLAPSIAFAQEMPDDEEEILESTLTSEGTELIPLKKVTGVIPPLEELAAPRRKLALVDPYLVNGYDSGSFQIKPSFEISGIASNNIAMSSTNRVSDVGVTVKPSVTFQSDWHVHQWKGAISADWSKYNKSGSSSLTGSASTDFRLDIRKLTFAEFSVSANATQAAAGQSEVSGLATTPRRDSTLSIGAAITHDFGNLQLRLKSDASRKHYSDVTLSNGTTEVNSDRNYFEPGVSLRVSLGDEGARLKPYAEGKVDTRLHDNVLDRNGQKRNSKGASLALGITLDDGPIWMGDLAVTVTTRGYDDAALAAATAIGVNGSVTYSPSEPWSFVGSTAITLNETSQIGISALPTWTLGLNGTYALRDNVTLTAGNDWTFANDGTALNTTTTVRAGAAWKLNPFLALSASVQSTWMMAGVAANNYDEQRATVGVVLTP